MTVTILKKAETAHICGAQSIKINAKHNLAELK